MLGLKRILFPDDVGLRQSATQFLAHSKSSERTKLGDTLANLDRLQRPRRGKRQRDETCSMSLPMDSLAALGVATRKTKNISTQQFVGKKARGSVGRAKKHSKGAVVSKSKKIMHRQRQPLQDVNVSTLLTTNYPEKNKKEGVPKRCSARIRNSREAAKNELKQKRYGAKQGTKNGGLLSMFGVPSALPEKPAKTSPVSQATYSRVISPHTTLCNAPESSPTPPLTTPVSKHNSNDLLKGSRGLPSEIRIPRPMDLDPTTETLATSDQQENQTDKHNSTQAATTLELPQPETAGSPAPLPEATGSPARVSPTQKSTTTPKQTVCDTPESSPSEKTVQATSKSGGASEVPEIPSQEKSCKGEKSTSKQQKRGVKEIERHTEPAQPAKTRRRSKRIRTSTNSSISGSDEPVDISSLSPLHATDGHLNDKETTKKDIQVDDATIGDNRQPRRKGVSPVKGTATEKESATPPSPAKKVLVVENNSSSKGHDKGSCTNTTTLRRSRRNVSRPDRFGSEAPVDQAGAPEKPKSEQPTKPKEPEKRFVNTGPSSNEESPSNSTDEQEWSQNELELLRNAHKGVNPKSVSFWEDVSAMVGSKADGQCREKWFSLAKTPVLPTRKARVMAAANPSAEDDIFNATPMKGLFQMNTFAGLPNLDMGSAIKVATAVESSPMLQPTMHGYKAYVKKVKRDVNKGKNARPPKASKAQKTRKRIAMKDGEGDIEVKGQLSPGGTLKLNMQACRSALDDEIYDDPSI